MVAGHVLIGVADLLHDRLFGETDVGRVLAPGVEPAPAGGVIGEAVALNIALETSTVGAGSG